MQNKTLLIILAALSALLIFETGYLIGVGEQRRFRQFLASRYAYPQSEIKSGWDLPIPSKRERLVQTRRKSFFVAAMTSKDTDQAKIITVNLPGVAKNDISIEVDGRYLIIQVSQKSEANINKAGFSAQKLSSSDFFQTITLDENAKPQQIRAEFKKDTLTITIPKDRRSRKIAENKFNVPVK